jgi:ribonuclease HI
MGVFQLPITLCKELNQMMQQFWWSHMSKNSKIHWMSWSKMGRSKTKGGLGFRDLVIFNKALLAKQGWRLMQDPDSVAGKILKAKYFPQTSFLEAKLGSKPSYVWRSIFNAQGLLIEGLQWRVGDGQSIKIWGEKWLPTPSSYSVQSSPRSLTVNCLVADLIDYDLRKWKEELIQAEFGEEEAKTISGIPLNPLLPADKLIWRGTVNGEFSVRSAYHLGVEVEESKRGQCSIPGKDKDIWKTLWSLGAPNVVKMFIWRACNEVLPTRCNLFQRKAIENKICPCCEVEDDDALHALWLCPAAKDVWGCSSSSFQKFCFAGADFQSLFAYCMDRCTKDELDLMATTARRIWLRRNAWIFEQRFEHPDIVYNEAMKAWMAFKRCNMIDHEVFSKVERNDENRNRPNKWSPPPAGVLKVNWDASINVAKDWVGLGIIARDSNGLCMGAKCITIRARTDPKTAEFMATLQAVKFSKEVGFWDVIFEGDAAQVVKEIKSNSSSFSKVGHFIESIYLEKQYFQSTKFQAIPRSCNMAAHTLAKEASSKFVDLCWLDDTPMCVSSIVFREQPSP